MSRKFTVPLGLVGLASNPASGSIGDVYFNTGDKTIRVYYDSAWNIVGGGGGGASYTVSDTAPSSPSNGDVWFNSTSTRTYVYYSDGTSSQWVESSSPVAAVGLLDGGLASSTYGGVASINAGSA